MLCRHKKISDKEKSDVKDAAKKLLKRLKNNEFRVNQWAEKIQTSSSVKSKIQDILFLELPESYTNEDISLKTEKLFNEFKLRYADFDLVA